MTQSQHTPGPWEIQSDAKGVYGIVVKQTSPIRTHQFIASLHDSMGEEERQANAHLLAAAPDLLEALEKIEWYLEGLANTHGNLLSAEGVSTLSCRNLIAKTLKKAKGGQQ